MEASYEGMKVGHRGITFHLETQISMMDLRECLAPRLAIKTNAFYMFFYLSDSKMRRYKKEAHSVMEWDPSLVVFQSYFSFLCQIANGWGFNTVFQFSDKGPAIRWQISCKRALQEECQNAAPSFVIQMRCKVWCLASKTHFHICFVIRLPGSEFWLNPTVAQHRQQGKKTHAKGQNTMKWRFDEIM